MPLPILPFSSPGDLSDPGIEPKSPALQAGSLRSEPQGKPQRWGVALKKKATVHAGSCRSVRSLGGTPGVVRKTLKG